MLALTIHTVREFPYLVGIDAETTHFLNEKTDHISELITAAGRAVAKTGKHLAETRERLPYGWFEAWLRAEFRLDVRQAYRFINVYERFPELATSDKLSELDNVSQSALYLLAATSTPYEAVQEVRALAATGPVSYTETKAIIDRYKADYADPEETRGRRPDETREAIENAQACILNIMRLPQLVFEDGIRTPAQRARLTEIVKLAKEAHGYHLDAMRALGYRTT